MPRWSKGLLIAVAVSALLFGAAYWALLKTFPPQRLAAMLAQQVSEASGRTFRIDGALKLRLLPSIAVVAENVRLANPSGFSRPDMMRVQRAALVLRIAPLLHGDIKVDEVSLDGVDLLLETRAGGADNWQFNAAQNRSGPAPAPAGTPAQRSLVIDRLRLADVHLAYRDARGGAGVSIELDSLRIDRAGDVAHLDASAKVAARLWTLKGTVGSLSMLLANQADWPFDLQLQGVGAKADAKGTLAHGAAPRAVKLALAATLDKADALGAWATPSVVSALPLRLDARLDWNGSRLQVDPLQFSAAGQKLAGQLSARSGSPWQLRGALHADTIDLSRWVPPAAGSASSDTPRRQKLFDATPLPLSELPALRADIQLQLARVVIPGRPPLSNLKAELVLRPPELRADALSFGIADGTVSGKLALKLAAGAAPELNVQLEGRELSAPKLAQAAGARDYLIDGRARLNVALRMAGQSTQALAASVDGQLLLQASDLRLGEGKSPFGPNLLPQLLQALRPGRPVASDRIECAVVRLPFSHGVARIDRSIAIETPDLGVSATGRIDLRDETLELAFRPTPKGALGVNTAQLASLVMAKGPLLDPKLSLDAKGAADMALSIGAAVATGGLSMIGQNLLHQAADPHPCQFAATAKATAAPAEAQPPAKAPPAQPQLPGFLRKLFK